MENPISHNVYFDGKVQSLGLLTADGKATVGVMKKGSYKFSTSSAEKMVVVAGTLNASLDGSTWKAYNANEHFDVAAGTSFDVNCDSDAAYICYYE
jgi:uncharacterized protein YaiE (UPF0345 family)